MKDAYNYLKEKLNNNEYVVIAESGGPDSMALIDLLVKIRNIKNINIICAHVNHKVRIESEEEAIFVKEYCNKNNIIFEYMEINSYTQDNFENEARIIRYNFFEELLSKYNSKTLLTAHHTDDLMETILMRIVRGSSLRGYSGFSKELDKKNYKILRPLITCTKDEILKYNEENNIKYVIDKTNLEDIHTRNRYRHIVLPFLKKEDKNVHKKFLKFSETLQEYDSYINKIVLDNINNVYSNNVINISEFKKLDKLIQKKTINYILDKLYLDDIMLLTDVHTDLILDLINGNNPNGIVRLPENLLVARNYDEVSFKEEESCIDDYEIELIDNITLPNNSKIIFVDSEDSNSNYVCRLSSTEIKLPLYVRNRRDGDKMTVMHLEGTKKISEILINEKISMEERNKTPIVLDSNNNIVWLPGIKKSKYNKEKKEKYDIILKYVKEEK